jgi:hypothetical protein
MRVSLRIPSVILAVFSVAAGASAQQKPDTYGTTYPSFIRIPAIAFLPLDSTTGSDGTYTTTGTYGASGQITRYGPGDSFFVAPVNLPSGAIVTSLELDYCDNDSFSNRSSLQLIQTYYTGSVIAATPTIYSVYGGCDFVGQDVSSSGIVVDNNYNSCHLVFYHNVGDGGESIAGAIVGYKLQVSPPPGASDFGDVPTNHPFFQFIEALYHAGITGGCGGGNFCPDNPVTRGQMAVFLSKALGLAFR